MTAAALQAHRPALAALTWEDETRLIEQLIGIAEFNDDRGQTVVAQAAAWVESVRKKKQSQSPLDAFMHQYDLSSDEGVLLMCLAEALLRIPDEATQDKLIADKLGEAHWEAHLGKSGSLFVNASTWGLMLTGKIVRLAPETTQNWRGLLGRLVSKSTEPVIKVAIRQAMRMMGSQFVMGRSIEEAVKEADSRDQRPYLHSYDMLGEAALTAEDAERYFQAYLAAIAVIGQKVQPHTSLFAQPSISVKLSALHPRYEYSQRQRVYAGLIPKLLTLAEAAKAVGIGLTVDAEEADRLELSLDVIEAVYRNPALDGWEGFGLAVQAFQKRALAVIDTLGAWVAEVGRKMPVRLVKGAYWDYEVKKAQEQGLDGYPVFTRKANTDVAYLACARRLLAQRDRFYPMLASHNAHTVACVRAYAGDDVGYEFQRLHGMGEALYGVVRQDLPVPCRVYAPVGSHEDLLPYLVRRLLENGANTSFVNRIFDENTPASQLAADPIQAVKGFSSKVNPALPLPVNLFAPRRNSQGYSLAHAPVVQHLQAQIAAQAGSRPTLAVSLVAVENSIISETRSVLSPSNRQRVLGQWQAFPVVQVPLVLEAAQQAQAAWSQHPLETRAACLEKAADRLEADTGLFLGLLIDEAGKTWGDAIAELREAVDFLRYYAGQARRLTPQTLPGPTGEHNELQLHGKGVFIAISPWNFPLAIFIGQIAAALATGNAVIAKPAEQTPLIAFAATQCLHAAGIPKDVLQLVLGEGDLGAALVSQESLAGVVFTGSVPVAKTIAKTLASHAGAIPTLIAETGGLNAMIVDSSALPEQVVKDALYSAMGSAGQRCSALRVLYVQTDIADKVLHLLAGALQEWVIGPPEDLATDVGSIIDEAAQSQLLAHLNDYTLHAQLPLPESLKAGCYVPPSIVEVNNLSAVGGEHFGPILHVIRYAAEDLDRVIKDLNASGYGLTLGIHSRIEQTWRYIQNRVRVGNTYINRSMTGAVVGVQPFGGEGLSGTGPKAGGPHYLPRFCVERTLTINTSAVGGNARLLAASGDK
jgi:RHH-type proline utilization regulon transcriptional repressor/proline dehydrogenase/delta 1-pyrroline-5-carboxylate dehydrogenase